jgi:diguanylate cyclase (GGDEF)-like protein
LSKRQTETSIEALIISCDSSGTIRNILFREVSFCDAFQAGEFFLKNVDAGSLSKALTFFTDIKNKKIITNCEINFKCGNGISTLVLYGAQDGPDLIVLAASGQIESLQFDEIMAMNNEMVNMFRMSVKDQLVGNRPAENHEFNHFDEISRLNNELMNVQRELAKKNNELVQLNNKLEELTIRDPLTGLFNKRHLYPKFEEESSRSARFQYPIALVMIDLNNFKQINDQMGHSAGDRVLKQFASISTSCTRSGLDYVFRSGGDEFLVLMTHCEEETAEVILNRIDQEYRKTNDLSSIAFGISVFIGGPDQDLEVILKEADSKMYVHKMKVKTKSD